MIDDDDVAFLRPLMHGGDEAALELRTLLAGAQLAARVDLGPGGARFGQRLDLGAIAGLGGLLPLADDAEVGDFFQAVEDRLLLRIVDFLAAGVVAASLHVAGAQRPQVLFQERNVFEEKLLLQIFGAGRNHHALAAEKCRDQIRQRLPGAGACFDDQVLLLGERGFGGFRHRELPGAKFVIRMPLGKQSLTAKELAHSEWFGCGRHLLVDFSSRLQHHFFDIATFVSTSH